LWSSDENYALDWLAWKDRGFEIPRRGFPLPLCQYLQNHSLRTIGGGWTIARNIFILVVLEAPRHQSCFVQFCTVLFGLDCKYPSRCNQVSSRRNVGHLDWLDTTHCMKRCNFTIHAGFHLRHLKTVFHIYDYRLLSCRVDKINAVDSHAMLGRRKAMYKSTNSFVEVSGGIRRQW
jgi:hypothetical protein